MRNNDVKTRAQKHVVQPNNICRLPPMNFRRESLNQCPVHSQPDRAQTKPTSQSPH
jgi:hypothetical protein